MENTELLTLCLLGAFLWAGCCGVFVGTLNLLKKCNLL